MDRICPLMSKTVTKSWKEEIPEILTAEFQEIYCYREKCQFWTNANTTEGQSIQDCAIVLTGMVGNIRV